MLSYVITIGLFVHIPLVWTIYDFYYTSSVVDGIQRFSLPSSYTPAKRVVFIVADDLDADLLFTPKIFPGRPRSGTEEHRDIVAPYLRSVIQFRGAFGVSQTRAPDEGLVQAALMSGSHVPVVTRGWTAHPVDSLFHRSRRTYAFGGCAVVSKFAKSVPEGQVREWCRRKEGYPTESIDQLSALEDLEMLFTNATSDPELYAELNKSKTMFLLNLRGLETTVGLTEHTVTRDIKAVDDAVRRTELLVRTFYNDHEREGKEETAYVFTASRGTKVLKNYWDDNEDYTRTPLVIWGSGVRGPLSGPLLSTSPSERQETNWNDKYSEPLRNDLSSIDLAPLVATLLGIEWPADSVGRLPGILPPKHLHEDSHNNEVVENGFVVLDEKGMALAAEVNAKVMLEQLRVKQKIERFRKPAAFWSFSESSANLSSFSASLSNVNTLIQRRQFAQARIEAYDLIQSLSHSLCHVEADDRSLSQNVVNFAQVVWGVCCALAMRFLTATPLTSDSSLVSESRVTMQGNPGGNARTLMKRRESFAVRYALVISIFACFSFILWSEKASWKYFVYTAWPSWFWGDVIGRVFVNPLPSLSFIRGFRMSKRPGSDAQQMVEGVSQPTVIHGGNEEGLQYQLRDLLKWINEQRALADARNAREEKLERKLEDLQESLHALEEDMVRGISSKVEDFLIGEFQVATEKSKGKRPERAEVDSQPDPSELALIGQKKIIKELTRQNQEMRELLQSVSDALREDCERHHIETINVVRETAHEQVPFNVQGYLDEFSKALASEIRMLLAEVGKLREERRDLLNQIERLLHFQNTQSAAGQFVGDSGIPEPNTHKALLMNRPSSPNTHKALLMDRPSSPMAPKEPKAPAPQPPKAGWKHVTQRKRAKKAPPPPVSKTAQTRTNVGSVPPDMDPRGQVQTWETWRPHPALQPTPPSVEPTLPVPEQGSPGLFGPRTPPSSVPRGVRSVQFDVHTRSHGEGGQFS